jgi:hypothetical protein
MLHHLKFNKGVLMNKKIIKGSIWLILGIFWLIQVFLGEQKWQIILWSICGVGFIGIGIYTFLKNEES